MGQNTSATSGRNNLNRYSTARNNKRAVFSITFAICIEADKAIRPHTGQRGRAKVSTLNSEWYIKHGDEASWRLQLDTDWHSLEEASIL
jgi:hypothetical protein